MVVKTSQEYVEIAGIRIDSTHKKKVLRSVRERIGRSEKFYIVTPNPEIVMLAQKDNLLLKAINSAALSLPDGIGLAQAKKFFDLPNPKDPIRRLLTLFVQGLGVGLLTILDSKSITKDFKIIKGREMFMELMKLANKKGWRVFLLGGEKKEAIETAKVLSASLKKVIIETHQGPMLRADARPISDKDKNKEKRVIAAINKFKPHLLFVAFKFPRQEKWVYKHMDKLNVGGAMVVGGTYNYISGHSKPPPAWMENHGLEWVWRLLTQPVRTRRILTAFPAFPLRVFWDKLTNDALKDEKVLRK